jgi:Tol biopolymer transport system component
MLSRDMKGGSTVTLFRPSELNKMDDSDIVWLRGGRVLYSLLEPSGLACNYWSTRLDLSTGKHLEEPRRITNWPNLCANGGSATNDGKQFAFAVNSTFYTGYIGDLQAGETRIANVKHFTLEDSDDAVDDWTPDSKAVLIVETRGDHYSLYKQSLESDEQTPIVTSVAGGVLSYAIVSPDGKWIIALVAPQTPPYVPFSIVRISIAGGVPVPLLQVARLSPVTCSRSPSGGCVIAEQSDDHKQMIVSKFDPEKGRGPELARFDLARDIDLFADNLICAISPDGTRLAIARSPESAIEIQTVNGQLLRTVPSRISDRKSFLSWAADQRGFFVTRRASGGEELLHLDLQGNEKVLRNCVLECIGIPSPDGRHLAIIDVQSSANMWMMENF